jgi:hypothetical protein
VASGWCHRRPPSPERFNRHPANGDDGDGEGKKLALSNLEKVLYPEAGFTKGHVIDCYIRIAPVAAAAFKKSADHAQALSRRREWILFL